MNGQNVFLMFDCYMLRPLENRVACCWELLWAGHLERGHLLCQQPSKSLFFLDNPSVPEHESTESFRFCLVARRHNLSFSPKSRNFFLKYKIQFSGNVLAKPTMQMGGIILKLLPLASGAISQRCMQAWHINSTHSALNPDDGSLLRDTYLQSLITISAD